MEKEKEAEEGEEVEEGRRAAVSFLIEFPNQYV